MKLFDDNELREILMYYQVSEPREKLVAETKDLMREKILQQSVETLKPETSIFLLVALTIAMSLCLFYMFTVGTILWLVLPPYLLDILRHTLYGLTAAGSCLIVCALMVLCFKQCLTDVGSQLSLARNRY